MATTSRDISTDLELSASLRWVRCKSSHHLNMLRANPAVQRGGHLRVSAPPARCLAKAACTGQGARHKALCISTRTDILPDTDRPAAPTLRVPAKSTMLASRQAQAGCARRISHASKMSGVLSISAGRARAVGVRASMDNACIKVRRRLPTHVCGAGLSAARDDAGLHAYCLGCMPGSSAGAAGCARRIACAPDPPCGRRRRCMDHADHAAPSSRPLTKPLPQVIGVGGGGSNAVNSMQASNLQGVELFVANTDAQVGWSNQVFAPAGGGRLGPGTSPPPLHPAHAPRRRSPTRPWHPATGFRLAAS